MRLLAFVVVAAAFAVVGCSQPTTSEASRHSCADTFAGEWSIHGTIVGGKASPSSPCQQGASFDGTATISEALTKLTLVSEGDTSTLPLDPTNTDSFGECSYLAGQQSVSRDGKTYVSTLEILANDDGSLTGTFTSRIFASDDLDANGDNATPECSAPYDLTFTR